MSSLSHSREIYPNDKNGTSEKIIKNVYENQRRDPLCGWSKKLAESDCVTSWIQIEGETFINLKYVPIHPEDQNWTVDVNEGTDKEGWEYNTNFDTYSESWKTNTESEATLVRRRKWTYKSFSLTHSVKHLKSTRSIETNAPLNATLEEIILYLTQDTLPESEYVDAIVLTLSTFTNSEHFISLLRERWLHTTGTRAEIVIIRLRVISVLNRWLMKDSETLLEQWKDPNSTLNNFLAEMQNDEDLNRAAALLSQKLSEDKNTELEVSEPEIIENKSSPFTLKFSPKLLKGMKGFKVKLPGLQVKEKYLDENSDQFHVSSRRSMIINGTINTSTSLSNIMGSSGNRNKSPYTKSKNRPRTYTEFYGSSDTDSTEGDDSSDGSSQSNLLHHQISHNSNSVNGQYPIDTELYHLPVSDVAKQMTLIEYKLVSKLRFKEFLNLAWISSSKDEKAPTIVTLIRRSTEVGNWVSTEILRQRSLKKRCTTLKWFIQLASELLELNNFCGLMEILGALNSAPVTRLSKTWEAIQDRRILGQFEEMDRLMAPWKNFQSYRDILSTRNPPVTPFIGIWLTDITMIEEANQDMTENGLINVEKKMMISKIITQLNTFISSPYPFQESSSLQKLILSKQTVFLDPEYLWYMSINVEPKASNFLSDGFDYNKSGNEVIGSFEILKIREGFQRLQFFSETEMFYNFRYGLINKWIERIASRINSSKKIFTDLKTMENLTTNGTVLNSGHRQRSQSLFSKSMTVNSSKSTKSDDNQNDNEFLQVLLDSQGIEQLIQSLITRPDPKNDSLLTSSTSSPSSSSSTTINKQFESATILPNLLQYCLVGNQEHHNSLVHLLVIRREFLPLPFSFLNQLIDCLKIKYLYLNISSNPSTPSKKSGKTSIHLLVSHVRELGSLILHYVHHLNKTHSSFEIFQVLHEKVKTWLRRKSSHYVSIELNQLSSSLQNDTQQMNETLTQNLVYLDSEAKSQKIQAVVKALEDVDREILKTPAPNVANLIQIDRIAHESMDIFDQCQYFLKQSTQKNDSNIHLIRFYTKELASTVTQELPGEIQNLHNELNDMTKSTPSHESLLEKRERLKYISNLIQYLQFLFPLIPLPCGANAEKIQEIVQQNTTQIDNIHSLLQKLHN